MFSLILVELSTGTFPTESVNSLSDLYEVYRHGVPVMGWILMGVAMLVAWGLIILGTSGGGLILIPIHSIAFFGVYFIIYALFPPVIAWLTLIVGTITMIAWGIWIIDHLQ